MLPAIGCGLRSRRRPTGIGPDAHSDIGRSGVAAALARSVWLAARRGIRAVERVGAGPHGQEPHRGAPWRADTDCVEPRAVPRIPQPALPRAAGAARRDRAAVAVVLGARRGSRLGWIAPLGRDRPRGAIPEGEVRSRIRAVRRAGPALVVTRDPGNVKARS